MQKVKDHFINEDISWLFIDYHILSEIGNSHASNLEI